MPKFIYNQHSIPKEQYRYGLRASAQTGCGWIATYNALALLGYRTDIQRLIRYYERQVPLIHGTAGTTLFGPAVCFRHLGFPVEMVLKKSSFDAQATRADACILFYRWRKGMKFGAHFVALHHTEQGFVGYNTFRNSTGPDHYGESLETFLDEHGYFGAVLTTIQKKERTLSF